jgi:hypothetical protein
LCQLVPSFKQTNPIVLETPGKFPPDCPARAQIPQLIKSNTNYRFWPADSTGDASRCWRGSKAASWSISANPVLRNSLN